MNKIFLTKIELENFQKHTHLVIEFVDGVNIINGSTDIGKSCIRRAISWIYFNEPTGDVIRKTGTKKTSVKVWLNTGNTVERIKSDTVNAYILNEDDKNRYDSIGKQIPEEIRKILGIYPLEVDNEEIILNIAEQITMPFLMDKSGTFRNKLFNKLTGADLLDSAMQGLNSDLLHINKEEKSENQHLQENQTELELLNIERDKKEKQQEQLTKYFNLVKKATEQQNRLLEYKESIDKLNTEILSNQEKINSIKSIDEDKLTELDCAINTLEILNELLYNIKQNKKELLELEELNNKIKIPKIDVNDLRNKIEQLTRLQKIIEQINRINSVSDNLITTSDNLNKEIEQDKIKYKELLKQAGVCPTCKQSTERL